MCEDVVAGAWLPLVRIALASVVRFVFRPLSRFQIFAAESCGSFVLHRQVWSVAVFLAHVLHPYISIPMLFVRPVPLALALLPFRSFGHGLCSCFPVPRSV